MIGSQYIHPSSGTNDDEENSSDFVDSDDQEVKENTVGLNKKNSQHLRTLFHVFKVIF